MADAGGDDADGAADDDADARRLRKMLRQLYTDTEHGDPNTLLHQQIRIRLQECIVLETVTGDYRRVTQHALSTLDLRAVLDVAVKARGFANRLPKPKPGGGKPKIWT